MKRILTICALLIFLVSLFNFSTKKQTDKQKPLVVYLVRHAEKFLHSMDPELTDSGKERALELVKILKNANIEYVHSTDYIRTRETAKPTAEKFGLTTKIYNPNDLEGLANKLKSLRGNHLVVGHSNTTPELATILGVNEVTEIDEASEFDRLYIVMVSNNNTSSVLVKYGTPYIEK